jgi:hypothetical protein
VHDVRLVGRSEGIALGEFNGWMRKGRGITYLFDSGDLYIVINSMCLRIHIIEQ